VEEKACFSHKKHPEKYYFQNFRLTLCIANEANPKPFMNLLNQEDFEMNENMKKILKSVNLDSTK